MSYQRQYHHHHHSVIILHHEQLCWINFTWRKENNPYYIPTAMFLLHYCSLRFLDCVLCSRFGNRFVLKMEAKIKIQNWTGLKKLWASHATVHAIFILHDTYIHFPFAILLAKLVHYSAQKSTGYWYHLRKKVLRINWNTVLRVYLHFMSKLNPISFYTKKRMHSLQKSSAQIELGYGKVESQKETSRLFSRKSRKEWCEWCMMVWDDHQIR